jgi:hypothetical protein
VPADGDWAQLTTPQASEAQVIAGRQRLGMTPEQAWMVMVTGKADELVIQVQLSTGGMVSTTVTVWLHWSWLPQSSDACQVRVMT